MQNFSSISDWSIWAATKTSETTLLIELKQQQKKVDSKKGHCLLDPTDVTFYCLHGWSVSLCVPLSSPRASSFSLTTLPAALNGWVEAGKKRERERQREAEEKKDDEDEDGGEGGLPSPGTALMKSLWSFAVIEQQPYPLQTGTSTSPKTPFPLPSRFPSLPLCQLCVTSSRPLSPLSYQLLRPAPLWLTPFHLLSSSVIRTWIMSLLN